MSTDETRQLLQLAKNKLVCLQRLREIGDAQDRLIEQGEMNHLLQLLATKQQALTALQSVERQLDPYRDQAPEKRVWQSPADREQCAKILEACDALLAQIIRRERDSEQRLSHRRDRVAAQLQGAHDAGRTRAAYSAATGPAAARIDLSTSE